MSVSRIVASSSGVCARVSAASRADLTCATDAIAQLAECQRVRRGSLTLNFAAARMSRIIASLARVSTTPYLLVAASTTTNVF